MDRETKNELLNTVLAGARKLGIAIEIDALNVGAGDDRIDALVRIGTGRQACTYAAEIKRRVRPATLGATLHQRWSYLANQVFLSPTM